MNQISQITSLKNMVVALTLKLKSMEVTVSHAEHLK